MPTQNIPSTHNISLPEYSELAKAIGLLKFYRTKALKGALPQNHLFNPVCGPAGLGVPWRDVDSVLRK